MVDHYFKKSFRYKIQHLTEIAKLKPIVILSLLLLPGIFGYNLIIALTLAVICGIIFCIWFYALGITLSKISHSSAADINSFKIAYFYICTCIVGLGVFLLFKSEDYKYDPTQPALIILLPAILGNLAILYQVIIMTKFIAKVSLMDGRKEERVVLFLLLWFLPIGIFILYPKYIQVIKRSNK